MTKPGQGDDFYRMNGAREMLVFSAADFENFAEPRPELENTMENELKDVVELLVGTVGLSVSMQLTMSQSPVS